ncbi:nagb/rpia/CoA transferase-like protein [Clavulina sp. PMI_390]|nr:nagb/rpia/CoA transferase-like protein [Clavulina sp. PMI_390]
MPIAAVHALTELIKVSEAETMYELLEELKAGANALKASTHNPISLTAGTDMFVRWVTIARQDHDAFEEHKSKLVQLGQIFTPSLASEYRDRIAKHLLGFIPDEAVILTHSYSRVVVNALLEAHKRRRISVFVTEGRPRGLGTRTHEVLTAEGVPCTVILDTAVAYIMDRVDLVLVGSEAVVESGGLINAVGSYQMAIVAKALNKPLYALAESYKFLRSFPLSQYDLPTSKKNILTVPTQRPAQSRTARSTNSDPPTTPMATSGPSFLTPNGSSASRTSYFSPSSLPTLTMTAEQVANNPELDYTRPEFIANVVSDVGVLAPSAVSQYLVHLFHD